MKKQDVKEIKNEKIPPYDACDYCWKEKRGVYSEFSVYIHYKDKPNDLLCFKCLCPTCSRIKFWEVAGAKGGYFYQWLNGSINFNIAQWFIVKKLNLDAKGLEELLLNNPKRNSFTLDELPKLKVEEKPQFYEPIEEISEKDIPF